MTGITPLFQANWNFANFHLKAPENTLANKISKIVWNILSFPIGLGVRFAAKKLLLPAAWMHSAEDRKAFAHYFAAGWASFSKMYALQEYDVRTPDGATLRARHFHHQNSGPNTPTILLFHPNGALNNFMPYRWLIGEFLKMDTPCNFVEFDYRGVDQSQGSAQSANDLILDGEAMIQFAREKLAVPPHLLRFFGWSLGGSIAANSAVLHPECTGNIGLDRTFSSISQIVHARMPIYLKPFFFWIPWALRMQGWELNTTNAAKQLTERLLVIHHPEDSVIPIAAGLRQALKNNGLAKFIELPGIANERNHHCEYLNRYELRAGGPTASGAVADFLR